MFLLNVLYLIFVHLLHFSSAWESLLLLLCSALFCLFVRHGEAVRCIQLSATDETDHDMIIRLGDNSKRVESRLARVNLSKTIPNV